MAIDPLLIPMAGLIIPIVIVPTVLITKQIQRARELRHIEHMKALELRRGLPEHSSAGPVVIAMGAGVPVGVFGVTGLLATQAWMFKDSDVAITMWFAAMVVSVFSIWTASKLANSHLHGRQPNSMADVSDFRKVELDDADAFDVVSRRG